MLSIVEVSFFLFVTIMNYSASLKNEILNQDKEIDRNTFNSSSTIKTIFFTMIFWDFL